MKLLTKNAIDFKLVLRVDVTRDIDSINADIGDIINTIHRKKSESNGFKPLDIEAEMSAQTYIDKGFIVLTQYCSAGIHARFSEKDCQSLSKYRKWTALTGSLTTT